MPESVDHISKKLPDLKKVAAEIIHFADEVLVWTLQGDLGAGKTTFIKEVCELLGTDDLVNSPTFSLVNEYLLHDGASCYHFDFYRVREAEEAIDIGLDEYLYSGSRCFIEWPGIIADYLPENYLHIEIQRGENEERTFKVTKHG